jgi:hypothetical protein
MGNFDLIPQKSSYVGTVISSTVAISYAKCSPYSDICRQQGTKMTRPTLGLCDSSDDDDVLLTVPALPCPSTF